MSFIDLSVKRHLASLSNIRERALSISKKAAERMVKKSRSKHPPAEYDIGTEVLVRRFGTKSLKQAEKVQAKIPVWYKVL